MNDRFVFSRLAPFQFLTGALGAGAFGFDIYDDDGQLGGWLRPVISVSGATTWILPDDGIVVTLISTNATQCDAVQLGAMSAGTETAPVMIPGYALNIERFYGFCEDATTGSATIDLKRCTGVDKTSCSVIGTIVCNADSTLDEDLTLSNTAIAANQMVWSAVTAVGAGGTDNALLTVCHTRN